MTSFDAHLSQQPQPAEVVNDKIRIGTQLYEMSEGGNVIRDTERLKEIAKHMNRLLKKNEMLDAAGQKGTIILSSKDVSVVDPKTKALNPINFNERVQTRRGLLTNKQEIQEHHTSRIESIRHRIQQKSALTAKFDLLRSQYGDDVVSAAFEQILTSPKLKRGEMSFGHPKTLVMLLQEPGNEGLYEAIFEQPNKPSHKVDKAKVEACQEELTRVILESCRRNPKDIEDANSTRYVQSFAKGVKEAEESPYTESSISPRDRLDDFAYPSISDANESGKRAEVRAHNTNMGCITQFNATGEKVVVVNRSGKSDSRERLVEVVKDALINRLNAGQPLTEENGQLVFYHQIDTHLDLSMVKKYFVKEDERSAMLTIMRAQKKWPEAGIKCKVSIGGVEKEVLLKRPIIRSQILSGLAAHKVSDFFPEKLRPLVPEFLENIVTAKRDSARFNFASNQELFTHYLRKFYPSGVDDRELQAASTDLAKKLGLSAGQLDFTKIAPQTLFEKGDRLFESKEFKRYYAACATFILKELEKAEVPTNLFILYSVLFQRKLPQNGSLKEAASAELQAIKEKKYPFMPAFVNEVSASDMEIYADHLVDLLGFSKGKQCKSGKDRTAISMSLAVALARFQSKFQRQFIPDERFHSDADLQAFRGFFAETLAEFGFDITIASIGESGLKLGEGLGNPVVLQYMPERYLEPGSRVKGDPYSGKLVEKSLLLGMTDKAAEKEALRTRQMLLSPDEKLQYVNEAMTRLNHFFHYELGLSLPLESKPFFSKTLDLIMPVNFLKLDSKIPNTKETRLERIVEKIKLLEKGGKEGNLAENYSLHQLQFEINRLDAKAPEKGLFTIALERRLLQIAALKQVVDLYNERVKIKDLLQKRAAASPWDIALSPVRGP